jgi:transcriptional regulator with XRE-family HTH domain
MSSAGGKRRRPRPKYLHAKLRQIREAYNLSQSEMVSRLGLNDELHPSEISAFERDPANKWSREPALPHLLQYARAAGVSVEVLIDDELELPDKLAPDPSHGLVRKTTARSSKQTIKSNQQKRR